jgi:hypothetical protein
VSFCPSDLGGGEGEGEGEREGRGEGAAFKLEKQIRTQNT